MHKFRTWLIRKAVGRLPVMMNMHIRMEDGTLYISNDQPIIVNGNQITGSPK